MIDWKGALNLLYFYKNLNGGLFDKHKENWVIIYKQNVVKYEAERCTKEQESKLYDEMPGVIYFPINSLAHKQYFKVPVAR